MVNCPCGGRCHHGESPCSLGCWATQKPWKIEELIQEPIRIIEHVITGLSVPLPEPRSMHDVWIGQLRLVLKSLKRS